MIVVNAGGVFAWHLVFGDKFPIASILMCAFAGISSVVLLYRAWLRGYIAEGFPEPHSGHDDAPAAAETVYHAGRVAKIRETHEALITEWGLYKLDIAAWYLRKPLLRDCTGTVPATAEYQRAMAALEHEVETITTDWTDEQISAAEEIADHAWAAWHAANDYAESVGLDDRTPTERAALQRLAVLVERLTLSPAGDPEAAQVKREIERCLAHVTTVSASITDIVTLPAIADRGHYPQIEQTAQPVGAPERNRQ